MWRKGQQNIIDKYKISLVVTLMGTLADALEGTLVKDVMETLMETLMETSMETLMKTLAETSAETLMETLAKYLSDLFLTTNLEHHDVFQTCITLFQYFFNLLGTDLLFRFFLKATTKSESPSP